jgi:aminoglycoside phosphotransferase (APT) family kinase protein
MADPPESLLKWAAFALGEEASVVSVTGLHGGSSPWRLHVVSPDATTDAILRTAVDPPRWPDGPMARFKLARGVAALRVAEQHGLAAPRLIACDLDGHEAGLPASLETVLPGNSGWPKTPTAAGWRDAGAAIAGVHRVPLQPVEHLPLRSGDVRSRASVSRSKPLLQLADEVVRRHEPPRGESVFLHGDVWPGNLLWIGDRCVGLIDWKEACVGDPGSDLANLRYHAALHHGPDGALLVLQGWEDEIGRKATDVAYWDAVWALYSRDAADVLTGPDWSHGTTDRRDAFLRAAVDELV